MYKIHGCVTSPLEVRITKDELKANYGGWVSDYLKSLLRTNALVFVGLGDITPVVLAMIKDVFESLKTVPFKPFWVTDGNPSAEASELLAICDATPNHLRLSAREFLSTMQDQAIRDLVLEISEEVISKHIASACKNYPENLKELVQHKSEIVAFIKGLDNKKISQILRLSRIDFGDPYMQLNGRDESVGRLFFWMTMLSYCLGKLPSARAR